MAGQTATTASRPALPAQCRVTAATNRSESTDPLSPLSPTGRRRTWRAGRWPRPGHDDDAHGTPCARRRLARYTARATSQRREPRGLKPRRRNTARRIVRPSLAAAPCRLRESRRRTAARRSSSRRVSCLCIRPTAPPCVQVEPGPNGGRGGGGGDGGGRPPAMAGPSPSTAPARPAAAPGRRRARRRRCPGSFHCCISGPVCFAVSRGRGLGRADGSRTDGLGRAGPDSGRT